MLDDFEHRLFAWADWIKQRLLEEKPDSEIIHEFQAFVKQSLVAVGVNPQNLLTYEQAVPPAMSVAGLNRYWKKIPSRTSASSKSLEKRGHAL